MWETRSRIGKPPSEETRAKMSLAHLGNKYALGFKHSEETKEKIRQAQKLITGRVKATRLGVVLSEETKRKISIGNTGKIRTPEQLESRRVAFSKFGSPLKGRSKPPMAQEIRDKISLTKTQRPTKYWLGKKRPPFSEESRRKKSESLKKTYQEGKHPNWKGGISQKNRTERENIMSTLEYKLWREKVFERDGFRCQLCRQTGKTLNANHIKLFSKYPELRLSSYNGISLCIICHKYVTRREEKYENLFNCLVNLNSK